MPTMPWPLRRYLRLVAAHNRKLEQLLLMQLAAAKLQLELEPIQARLNVVAAEITVLEQGRSQYQKQMLVLLEQNPDLKSELIAAELKRKRKRQQGVE